MAAYLKNLNPVPSFPGYTGPYKVGTTDVELPVAELEAPSAPPDETIDTVQFRVFYPCESEFKHQKHISWLPSPQRAHVSAYTKFLGAGSTLAEVISFFPQLLYYISVPARKNALVLQPPEKRWPVMIFSHGLAGSRNAYSHVAGSIASHGVIVIAPEHRDGSAPITYIREVPKTNGKGEKSPVKKSKRIVNYTRISHTPSPEVEDARAGQLKIRLWELGCIHDALLKIDEGVSLTNLNTSSASFLPNFRGKMAVHEPGSIAFAGHSFGGTTVTQFIKSTFYAPETSNAPAFYEPLFVPSSRSKITSQITPNTPIILLDVWCYPLRAAKSRWLWNKPLPCYTPGGPGGSAILAVESQAFYKWGKHLKATKRLLSPNPAEDCTTADNDGLPAPHFYYPVASAHLSQSDFGILFPWITRKIFAIEDPERIMKLNVRAILQLLRERHIPVSQTSPADMEMDSESDTITENDVKIFSTNGEIKGWHFLTTDVSDLQDVTMEDDSGDDIEEPSDAVVSGEMMQGMQGTGERLQPRGVEISA